MMNTRAFTMFTTTMALLAGLCAARAAAQAPAAPPEPIAIWPGDAPGEKGDIGAEVNKEAANNKLRITNVTRPTIAVHRPAPDKDTGAAVIVCPGGGYSVLAADIEGEAVCRWLNDNGVTGILLKYRVPRRAGREKHEAPLQDVQRAVGIVRHRAKEWNIDPHRVGVIGFSAGGHLCATLGGQFDQRTYPPVDDADKESCRPDFSLLIYPFYLTTDQDTTKLAPEVHVTDKTPPAFIVYTEDDRVHYAFAYALAMKQAKVPFELHVFPTGGHGYALGRPDNGGTQSWPKLAEEWLKRNGWLKTKD